MKESVLIIIIIIIVVLSFDLSDIVDEDGEELVDGLSVFGWLQILHVKTAVVVVVVVVVGNVVETVIIVVELILS